ncbi:MAG: bifunctional oligoribonuclease/PAP phosphatase NrnA [Ignavibacteria bacterium]|nr:bifunctional oligoribonuclease/PAP phosphatase NrnA [Ignavibacteria bacterium]
MIDFKKFVEIVNKNSKFVITTHINPDGDALGSQLALAYFLKKLGKEVELINHSQTPGNYKFLNEENLIKQYNKKFDNIILNADALIAVDFNEITRVKSMVDVFQRSKAYKICIDHHTNPKNFVDEFFCDTDYSATGEIIFELIKSYGENLFDKKIADALYTAIMTDTGSFRFERTSPKVHRIIAELLEMGTNPTEIYNKIYNELSTAKLKLLGSGISNIQSNSDGSISYMVITQEMLKSAEANEEDVDGFVNFCLSIKSAKIGILFFELADGVKASLRSRDTFPVSLLAEKFGGGGHINAAGIRFYDKQLDEVIPQLLQQTEKDLTEFEKRGSNAEV